MPPERRTLRAIIKELVEHPFFPILFVGEFIKQLVENGVVIEYGILALVAILLWIFSDVFDWEMVKEDVIGFGDGNHE